MVKISFIALIIFLTACGDSIETDEPAAPVAEQQLSSVVSCEASGGLTLYCGVKKPKDLEIVPGVE